MSKLSIVARLKVKPEAVEQVKSELTKLVAPTRKEEGCLEYNLHQDNDTPELFVFYENWESAAHLDRHKESDHYRHCFGTIGGLIEERSLQKLTCLE
ncbi:antibiotic biosynthesis monooxygenase [Geomonas sp. Red276]